MFICELLWKYLKQHKNILNKLIINLRKKSVITQYLTEKKSFEVFFP